LTCFKGYLLRAIIMLNKCEFRIVSYSPDTILIAEHLTEAYMVASFPGQLNYPSQLNLVCLFRL